MARTRKTPTDAMLARAVEMRVGGEPWKKVAEEMDMSVASVKQWPIRCADRWLPLLAAAEGEMLQDLKSESILTLRQLLRSKLDPVRHKASETVQKIFGDLPGGLAGRVSPSPVPEVRQLVAYLESLSEGQFRELFEIPDDPPPPALAG